MIESILKFIGFHPSRDLPKYTEVELLNMLAEFVEGEGYEFTSKQEEKMFGEVKNVDGFVEYLKDACSKDIKRYFAAATPAEQIMIRGAFSRTNYLRAKIAGEKSRKTKIEGVRYE